VELSREIVATAKPIGILTYENVIEIILDRQIEDEFDEDREETANMKHVKRFLK